MAYTTGCKNHLFPTGSRVRHATDTSCCSGLSGTVVDGPASSYGVTVSFDGSFPHQHYVSTECLRQES